MKFHANNFNGFQRTVRTRNSIASYQREITPKIKKADFRFSCMTHWYCVLQLYGSGFQLTEQKRNSIPNDQRKITPKIWKAELWFLHITHCLIVLYKCMKFHPNSLNSFQLREWTHNCIYLSSKGNKLNNIIAR